MASDEIQMDHGWLDTWHKKSEAQVDHEKDEKESLSESWKIEHLANDGSPSKSQRIEC